MPYDITAKFIAEHFSADLATWLLGRPIALTRLEPAELSLEPIRADSLILLESEEVVLHCELQVAPKSNIPLRLADYFLRLHRRYPQRQIY
jgi:predicted transposase/invertase (TIGR01784 family)